MRNRNPGLTEDVFLFFDEEENRYYGKIPKDARVKELIANFDVPEGAIAKIDGVIQESGVTINDFSRSLNYTVNLSSGDDEVYKIELISFTGLPMIYLETENGAKIQSKEEYINAKISINGIGLYDDIEEQSILIRGRGNSTWGIHPKKPYQIKFPEKQSMLDMPKDRKWLFLAEYSDKTFMRNRVAFEMGYQSNLEWTPEGDFAEVFLNGQHQGLYHICQKVEESSNRVDISNDGFLLEIDQLDRLDDDDIYFYSDHFLLNIKDPDLEEKNEAYYYIRDYVDEFEKALFSPSFKDPVNGYRKYIDVASVVDWYIINEVAKNVDAKWFASIFMYKRPGEKIKFGPLWDFDLGYGNVDYADSEFPEGWWVRENAWINRMFSDPYFIGLLKQRYSYFRSKSDLIFENIDETADYIYLSQYTNNEIWQTLGIWVWPNSKVFSTYEEEVDYLKQWIILRLDWLDNEIPNL